MDCSGCFRIGEIRQLQVILGADVVADDLGSRDIARHVRVSASSTEVEIGAGAKIDGVFAAAGEMPKAVMRLPTDGHILVGVAVGLPATVILVAISASRNCTAWWLMIFWPKASRSPA